MSWNSDRNINDEYIDCRSLVIEDEVLEHPLSVRMYHIGLEGIPSQQNIRGPTVRLRFPVPVQEVWEEVARSEQADPSEGGVPLWGMAIVPGRFERQVIVEQRTEFGLHVLNWWKIRFK